MSSNELQNNLKSFKDGIKPSYIKKINNRLTISLTYLNPQSNDNNECLLSFHNTSKENIIINPKDHGQEQQSNWFSNMFGVSDTETRPVKMTPTNEIKIFLGYIQLFGYIVLNYKFGLASASNPMDLGSKISSWWTNKEYVNHYQDNEDEDEDDVKESKLDRVPFIEENLKNRLIIGGKLGGVNDLIIDNSNNNTDYGIDESNQYLLQDLLYPFNSIKTPESIEEYDSAGESKLSVKELTDSIIPIYSTSQTLLFTDLSLCSLSTRTYRLRFQTIKDLPPSYNTRSTGPVCDQGWISIKYSLIVGLSLGQQLRPLSIYFPLEVKGERHGSDSRWLQKDYLQDVKIDKEWKPTIIDEDDQVRNKENHVQEPIETRDAFLQDLSKLIESDLYSMPKTSTNERKKSFHTIDNEIEPGLIPQLSNHLKTQYQIKVNNFQLCFISLSKPYFHIGDDINFIIDICPKESSFTKVVGLVVHLEAHEIFKIEHKDKLKDYNNIYRVSPSIKFNSFSSSMINSLVSHHSSTSSLLNGSINIPKHLSQQFQCSKLMNLKYYIVFKFNINEFKTEEASLNSAGNGHRQSHDEREISRDETSGDLNEEGVLLTEPEYKDTDPLSFINDYKFDNTGSEVRFRLPITVLP